MKTEAFESFRSSLLRCLSNLHFLERFYHEFISSSPEIAQAFAHTNMERQKAMLNASLYQLMNFYGSDEPQSKKYIQQLGAQHGVYGHKIPPHMYDLWLESLMTAVKASDPQFDSSLEAIWLEVMGHGIEVMKASSHLYPAEHGKQKQEASIAAPEELLQLLDTFKQHAKEAAHRSDFEKDIEVTAFQFGQYRAYMHVYESLKDVLNKYNKETQPVIIPE
ncbi:MAG: globin [Rhodothermaceae bacterium]|nr:globin [Rhodothermaceae bacterium]